MAGDATVGDFVALRRGTTYQGVLVGKPGPALLGLGSIVPGGGFRADFKTYGGDCPPELMLVPGDLFVSLKGATKDGEMIGSVARVPSTVPSGRLTQDTVKLVFRECDSAFSQYLYWLLRTPDYRDYCRGRAMGSAVVALSREDFLSYPVPRFASSRRRIVEVLERIDDKIELNRKTNATLEAMARALFKSWFIDFDPVRAKAEGRTPSGMPPGTAKLFPSEFVDSELGPIPKGWSPGDVSDVATNRRDTVHPNDVRSGSVYIGLEHIPRGRIFFETSGVPDELESLKAQFSGGDVLFGKLRPYFKKVVMAPCSGICSTDILVLSPKAHCRTFVALLTASDPFIEHAVALSDGTRMPRTSWEQLTRFEIVVPPTVVLQAFEQQCSAVFLRAESARQESATLARIRDDLLPRLLSGELTVDAAARSVEEIA